MFTLLVSGSRGWSDRDVVEEAILSLLPDALIHGNARGLDRTAASITRELNKSHEGFSCIIHSYPAEWQTYGNQAGLFRNTDMLIQSNPDLVFAFRTKLSRGTSNLIETAEKRGYPTAVLEDDDMLWYVNGGYEVFEKRVEEIYHQQNDKTE